MGDGREHWLKDVRSWLLLIIVVGQIISGVANFWQAPLTQRVEAAEMAIKGLTDIHTRDIAEIRKDIKKILWEVRR